MPVPASRRYFRGRSTVLLCVALSAAVTLAGCTGAEQSGKSTPVDEASPGVAVGSAGTIDSVRGLWLPSEAYKPTTEERNVVLRAEQKLIGECMSRFGFTWTADPKPMLEDRQLDRAYGIGDLVTAQQFGYHLPSGGGGPKPTGGTPMSPTELVVFAGNADGSPSSYEGQSIPGGGCSGEARRAVTGVDDIDPTMLADSIAVAAWERSKSENKVVSVIKSWAACMKQSGYNYSSPLKAYEGDEPWSPLGQPTPAEIQAAVTDMKCKQSTNLIGIWYAVECSFERPLIQQKIEQLTGIQKKWTEAARKAAAMLGVPAPKSK